MLGGDELVTLVYNSKLGHDKNVVFFPTSKIFYLARKKVKGSSLGRHTLILSRIG